MSTHPKISIVMASYNRAKWLKWTLESYMSSNFKDFEIILVDDDSQDNTEEVCREYYNRGMDIKYIKLFKTLDHWRDAAAVINVGIRASIGQLIITTHPEVMVGNGTLTECWENVADNLYICAKPYYMSITDQENLEKVMESEGIDNIMNKIRNLPNFYNQPSPDSGPDYRPVTIEATPIWESWVFGGLTKDTWRAIGGMWECDNWGSNDLVFWKRRNVLGIKNYTNKKLDGYVVHQNHETDKKASSDRNFEECCKYVDAYVIKSKFDAIQHNV